MLIKFIVNHSNGFHVETFDIDMRRNRIWKIDSANKGSYLKSLNDFILKDIHSKRIVPE